MAKQDFLYLQVYNDLKRKIDEGVYRPGEKLPRDRDLKEKYDVSMITVRRALEILKKEEKVQRVPGVGTFVADIHDSDTEQTLADSQVSRKIGVVMEHVSSSYGLDFLYKVDQLAEEKGYKTIIRFSYYDRTKEDKEIDFLIETNVDGLIVMPCHGVYYNPKILKLILEGFPIVVIDKKLDGIPVPSVRTDNRRATKDLVKHLWQQGCRNLGFVSAQVVGTSSLQDRRDGFYEAINDYGLRSVSECTLNFDETVYDAPPNEHNVNMVSDYLVKHKGSIDGIVCAEYSLMPAILEASRRTASGVGQEIKICCVDGLAGLPYAHMKQNEIEMAEQTIALLLAQINKTNLHNDIMIPAIFVPAQLN